MAEPAAAQSKMAEPEAPHEPVMHDEPEAPLPEETQL
jgi:hypothetical protein